MENTNAIIGEMRMGELGSPLPTIPRVSAIGGYATASKIDS